MKFRPVNKGKPCTICNKSSWCSLSEDGKIQICRRKMEIGATVKKDINGNEYYVYKGTIK